LQPRDSQVAALLYSKQAIAMDYEPEMMQLFKIDVEKYDADPVTANF
jgi:hypothetical protein